MNEDRLFGPKATAAGEVLFAIADGVGGSDLGGVAAQLALDAVAGQIKSATGCDLTGIFELARLRVSEEFERNGGSKSLATTLTVCLFDGDETITVGHVGDCRLYHLSQSGLVTRTRDQTELQRLLDQGIVRPQQAHKYRRRHVLTSSITPKRPFDLLLSQFKVTAGDRLLLVTDGFYEIVKKKELVALSLQHTSFDEYFRSVESLVTERRPTDDCSMVLVQFEDTPRD